MKAFAKETATYYEQHTNNLQTKLKVFTEKQSKETSSRADYTPDIPYTSPLPPKGTCLTPETPWSPPSAWRPNSLAELDYKSMDKLSLN